MYRGLMPGIVLFVVALVLTSTGCQTAPKSITSYDKPGAGGHCSSCR